MVDKSIGQVFDRESGRRLKATRTYTKKVRSTRSLKEMSRRGMPVIAY